MLCDYVSKQLGVCILHIYIKFQIYIFCLLPSLGYFYYFHYRTITGHGALQGSLFEEGV